MTVRERYRRWRRYRTVLRELRGYSLAELRDLGVFRVDIDRIALDTAYGVPSRRPGPASEAVPQ